MLSLAQSYSFSSQRSSDRIHSSNTAVNHVCPRLVDGRLGSVAARPVGVFKANGPLHPPASALPPHSQEKPSLWWSGRSAAGPRFATRTLFLPLRLRAGLIGQPLLAFVCHKLKKHFCSFRSTVAGTLKIPEPITAQCAQVDRSAGAVLSSNGIIADFISDGL